MDFFQVAAKRRSIRRFQGVPVPEADLRTMLEAARLAPSAENAQPWRFLVVRSQERLQGMGEAVRAVADRKIEEAKEDPARRRHLRVLRPFSTFFARAPAAIFALYNPALGDRPQYRPTYYDPGLQSVAAATCHLVLAATALGYGSCWATAPVDFAAEELEALLGVEPPWRLVAVVALGVAAEDPPARPRHPLNEMAYFLD